ncbi:unnamed protein product, partial [marine sediment metagenome]
MLINKLNNFLINNQINKIVFKFLRKSTRISKVFFILKHTSFISNWMDLILLVLNLKKNIDIQFKNYLIFRNFSKKDWRYLKYYIKVFKNDIIVEQVGRDYFAKIEKNKLKLLD